MCGIFGIVNVREIDPGSLDRKLNDFLGHRGPDARHSVYVDGVYLYHARLAIQDLENGRQPMQRDQASLVFNGEIYNHLSLRDRFGLNCKTRSDTETLMGLLHRDGKERLNELDGMFAFGYFDHDRKRLLLARDRAGEKPLYYRHGGSSFTFASELNALYAGSVERPEVSRPDLDDFLRQGFFARERTPYEGVRELLPGHWLEFDVTEGEITTGAYWSLTDQYRESNRHLSSQEALREVDDRLNAAVMAQLEASDIEVGTFLSGGIDSGLVTAIARRHKPDLRTFTVSFSGSFDEGPLARATAEHLGTDHKELKISFDDLPRDVENILGAYGEPFADDSAIPSWYVSREAKKYLTVILTGDGADELFGGYRRYVPQRYFDLYRERDTPFVGLLSSITRSFADNKHHPLNYVHRLAESARQSTVETYLSSTTDIFAGASAAPLKREAQLSSLKEALSAIGGLGNTLSNLDRALLYDFHLLLPGALLPKMDIASMQHALETRAPFLARDVMEVSARIHPSDKIRKTTTKALLRALSERYLPPSIVRQPKRGFEIPLRDWMDGILRPITNDLLASPAALYRDFMDARYVQRLQAGPVPGLSAEKRAKQLFTLLALECWNGKRKSLRL